MNYSQKEGGGYFVRWLPKVGKILSLSDKNLRKITVKNSNFINMKKYEILFRVESNQKRALLIFTHRAGWKIKD